MRCSFTKQPRRAPSGGIAIGALVLVALAFAAGPGAASTLGQVTAIERNRNIIVIGAERLRVAAESRLFEKARGTGENVVITWQSLAVGDYVLYEHDGAVLRRLERMDPAAIDAPRASPAPLSDPLQ